MKNNFKVELIYTGIISALIIIYGIIITSSSGLAFEYKIMEFTTSVRDSEFKILFWKVITFIGNSKPLTITLILISVYLIWKKRYKEMGVIIFSSLTVYELANVIKYIFKRIRPKEFFLIEMAGYSYPSGHSAVSVSLWWTLSLFNFSKNKVISKIIKGICIIMPFLIGYSRLALGVHWPTDIVFGWLLGSVGFIWSRQLFIRFGLDKTIKNI